MRAGLPDADVGVARELRPRRVARVVAAVADRLPVSREHVPALDGVRGIAIVLVMLFHTVQMKATRPAEIPLVFVSSCGWSGVELFFALSGYLITGILIDTRGQRFYARAFFARRALRILPLYVVAIGAITLALPLAERYDPVAVRVFAAGRWWYWTYTINILIARAGSWWVAPLNTSHLWSLAVEEQFYLVWPLVVALCPPRRLGAACLVIAAASGGLRALLVLRGVSPVAIYTLMPTHMDALALGGALAAARRDEVVWPKLGRWLRALARMPGPRWWMVVISGLVGMVLLDPTGYPWAPPMQVVGYAVLAIASVAFVGAALVARRGTPLARVLTGRRLRRCGRYSYGLYVWHYPILYALRPVGLDVHALPRILGSRMPAQLLALVVVCVLSYGAAWISYNHCERYFLRLKECVPGALSGTIRNALP